MKTENEYITDYGCFSNQELDFKMPDSFETIVNFFKTIKEYRDYSKPESPDWQEYILELFHVLGFTTEKQAPRLFSLNDIGVKTSPALLVGYVLPSENFEQIIPDLSWESYLFFASKYNNTNWGILTNGLLLKIFNFNKEDYSQAHVLVDIDRILESTRLDSFFTLYKMLTYIRNLKVRNKKESKLKRSSKEIVPTVNEYNLDYHFHNKPQAIIDLFYEIRSGILSLSNSITEKINKFYIAYTSRKNFCEIWIQRESLRVYVDADLDEIDDPISICRDMRNIGHHATGNTEIQIKKMDDIQNVLYIIEQSYNKNQK